MMMPQSIRVGHKLYLHVHRTLDARQGQESLNQALFTGSKLKPNVRDKLLSDARKFADFLNVPSLRIDDIILTGSNASYNYTPESDIDVHLLVDFSKLPFNSIADSYFLAEKKIWTEQYNPRIYGTPIEFYVQNTRSPNPLAANGIYSLTKNEWDKFPRSLPDTDDSAVNLKYQDYKHRIDSLLSKPHTIEDIDRLGDRIYRLRSGGLKRGGELSVENVTFKKLRSNGDLQRLDKEKQILTSRDLSLSEA